jgi:maltose alpha-D-glucosyltransferase/alpha-amylase
MSGSLWYKDAIIYQLHVRSFADSDGDGVGDFIGLASKLDYLQDLGISAIWLMPFYPSPLRDDGYDIADYQDIHPQYGTLDDFRRFLDAAHDRGLRVITELVLNHTSDQHPWFQRARRAPPGSTERDFYVWSDTPEKYADARIIFQDFEPSNWAYDRVAQAYYWHRFYAHQPDLNYDNPAVRDAIFPLLDFWLAMGVDGLRLDAVPYLFEREGTNCENLPETHVFLRALRRHVDAHFADRMLLAEANQWPEDAVAYFGQGDECHMAFHFPVMPRLFMAIHREDRFPLVDILDQTPPIPPNCQWAMFLRNHDELTLEMVTDEERDYMYRAYASDSQARINLGIRRRLAPLLGSNRRRIELMNGLLFALPGTPVLYYGDEIGMGDNIYLGDRNGVRTPMQWSADRNAGFSRANPQKLLLPIIIDPEYHYEAVNVEAQQGNPQSLLWWTKRLIDTRQRSQALSRGAIEFLHPDNRKVLAFLRKADGGVVLVVANLSRFVQWVELDLSAHAGHTITEFFGGTPFPPIGKTPYLLTLAPHSFFWFDVQPPRAEEQGRRLDLPLTAVTVRESWHELFTSQDEHLEAAAAEFYSRQGLGRDSRAKARLRDSVSLPTQVGDAALAVLDVEPSAAISEVRALWLALVPGQPAEPPAPDAVLQIQGAATGTVHKAARDPAVAKAMLDLVNRQGRQPSRAGAELVGVRLAGEAFAAAEAAEATLTMARAHSSGVNFTLGSRLALKLLTRLEEGPSPEVEFGRFLHGAKAPAPALPLAGWAELRSRQRPPLVVAVAHELVQNEGDALQLTLDAWNDYFERVVTLEAQTDTPQNAAPVTYDQCNELLGGYLDDVSLMATRLAELHGALASDESDKDFAPEPLTPLYQRSLYQSLRSQLLLSLDALARLAGQMSETDRAIVRFLQEHRGEMLKALQALVGERLVGERIRCHGNCRLAHILFTGKDYLFVDFQGGLGASAGQRRTKHSPLADLAVLLGSIEDAVHGVFEQITAPTGPTPGSLRAADLTRVASWLECGLKWIDEAAIKAYTGHAAALPLLPKDDRGRRMLIEAYALDRCFARLRYADIYAAEDLSGALASLHRLVRRAARRK